MQPFADLLRRHGFKATHQRMAILQTIESEGHIEIESLFKKLTRNFPSLAIGTLYRNLNELREKNILSAVNLGEQKTVYETTKNPHAHLVCEACGKIEDCCVDLAAVRATLKGNGFSVSDTHLTFKGRCADCA